MARLKDYYKKEVVPALVKEFGYKNPMEVPALVKIVVNMGHFSNRFKNIGCNLWTG